MKDKNSLKVLLVYPNLPMMLVPSIAISIFANIFKKQGYQVDLFDATHYQSADESSPQKRVKFLQARQFSEEDDLGVKTKKDLIGDFVKKVDIFKPDFIAFSVVEDSFLQCIELLRAISDRNIPALVGGVFVTAAPDVVISYPEIKMIALGEGEETILEVAEKVRKEISCKDVLNVWLKNGDGSVTKNKIRPLVDINKSLPDFSLFEESRFYRPMGGRIFKTFPLETTRGCPNQCTFCNSPMYKKFCKINHLGNFLRFKDLSQVRQEIVMCLDKHDAEYFYFIDDSFLQRSRKYFDEFVEMYKEFSVPFWFNTRPESITPESLKKLSSINCDRISVGVECGNEEFRRKVLNRDVSNRKIIEKMRILGESGIAFSINNIVGFPDETREMVFQTIELNREFFGYDTITVSIFTPYHGTELRETVIEKGYLNPDIITTHTTSSSLLKMPNLTTEEIDGLMRTFCMYVEFEKDKWPLIRKAEKFDEDGERIFNELSEKFRERFLSGSHDELKERFAK